MTLFSEQLERKESRARLSEKLEELRARISPGEVVDQLVEYARDSGGGDFVRTLGSQGLPQPAAGRPNRRRLIDRARGAASAIGQSTTDAKDRLSKLADRASSTASSLGDSAAAAFSGTIDAASGTAQRVGDTAASVGRRAASASRSFDDFCSEQPLVLAGLGLALEGALGAAFPSTETDSRLMAMPATNSRRALKRSPRRPTTKPRALPTLPAIAQPERPSGKAWAISRRCR